MSPWLSGQNNEESHYVRIELKSGTIIEGKLVQLDYQKQVEIQTPIGQNMVVVWDDIAELNFIDYEVEKKIKEARRNKKKKERYPYTTSGYFFSFDFGPPVGLDYWGYPVMGGATQFSVGRNFNKNSLAAVTGLEFYLWPEMTFIPLGLEWRGRQNEKDLSWFYYLQMGYGFVGPSEYTSVWVENGYAKGGMYFNPGIGIMNKTHEKRSWYLKFGYKQQNAYAEYDGWVWDFRGGVIAHIEEEIKYHRIEVKYGFIFD